MEEKWMRDPFSAILWGLAIVGFGVYVVLAALGYVSWNDWWAYLLIAVGLAMALELPIRILTGRYRLHRLLFTRTLIGGALLGIGCGGIVGFGKWWLAFSIIALGCVILIFGIWWWFVPRRQRKYQGSRKHNLSR